MLLPCSQSHRLPCALIVDLDQTLALIGNRDPYNASSCEQDTLNHTVAELLEGYQSVNPGLRTLIITSRPHTFQQPTERFLEAHGIRYDALFMREPDDWRPCELYKRSVFQTHIAGQYHVHAAFDDNGEVCRMWMEMGVPVYWVGHPEN